MNSVKLLTHSSTFPQQFFLFHNYSRFQKFLGMRATYGWLSGSKAGRHPWIVSCWYRWHWSIYTSMYNAACNACTCVQKTRRCSRRCDDCTFNGMHFVYQTEKKFTKHPFYHHEPGQPVFSRMFPFTSQYKLIPGKDGDTLKLGKQLLALQKVMATCYWVYH